MTSENPFKSPGNESQSAPKTRDAWSRRFLALGAIGATMAMLGIGYGVFMVGIPSQDPTPEMARREALHLAISGWATTIGSMLLLLAVFGWLIALVVRRIS